MKARRKKGFVGVDVADSSDDPLIHDKLLERSPAAAALAIEISTTEGLIKGLRAEVRQHWMPERVIHGPDDQPETSIII